MISSDSFEEKQLTVLRRKFLVGMPLFGFGGYLAARAATTKFGISKWPRRALHVAGALVTPVIGSMLIVHFNKAEIFRVGRTMMNQMEQLRKQEEGPFKDAAVREKWDQQMKDRKFGQFKVDEDVAAEYSSGIDYGKIVDDSVRK